MLDFSNVVEPETPRKTHQEWMERFEVCHRKRRKTVSMSLDELRHLLEDQSELIELRKAPKRRRLPNRRPGWIQKSFVGGHKIYLEMGEHPGTGELGEIFISMHREGSAFRSMMEAFAMLFSISIQHGVPLKLLVKAFKGWRFDPSGLVTGSDYVAEAKSLLDYIASEIEVRYLMNDEQRAAALERTTTKRKNPVTGGIDENQLDATSD